MLAGKSSCEVGWGREGGGTQRGCPPAVEDLGKMGIRSQIKK